MTRERADDALLATALGTPLGGPPARQEGPWTMANPEDQQVAASPRMAARLRTLTPSLVATFVLPIVVYFLLRPHVGGDATALAIGGAIPAAWSRA
jgi:hypothetical protein